MPEIKPLQTSMHVPVTSIFDDDSIKIEQASMETSLAHYKSMGYFSDTQGQLTPHLVFGSGQISNSCKGVGADLRSGDTIFPIICLRWYFRCSRAANSIVGDPVLPKI